MMDCEVNTVKVRVHRALQELRESFSRAGKRQAGTQAGKQGIGSMAQLREFAMNNLKTRSSKKCRVKKSAL